MTDIKKENTEIMIKMLNARALQEEKKTNKTLCTAVRRSEDE